VIVDPNWVLWRIGQNITDTRVKIFKDDFGVLLFD
jgi:hypothetical protein